ncbi:MAG: hypothetical protein LUE23_02120 [Lachnospiraceae bacterium]|nr:hypothetical protein [Lachnospiraceae bacterium]
MRKLDEKRHFWLWFLALFRKDMSDFKEKDGDKKRLYEKIIRQMRGEKQ